MKNKNLYKILSVVCMLIVCNIASYAADSTTIRRYTDILPHPEIVGDYSIDKSPLYNGYKPLLVEEPSYTTLSTNPLHNQQELQSKEVSILSGLLAVGVLIAMSWYLLTHTDTSSSHHQRLSQ